MSNLTPSSSVAVFRPTLTLEEILAVLELIIETPERTTPVLTSVRKKLALINMKHTAGISAPVYDRRISAGASLLTQLGASQNQTAREAEESEREYLFTHGTEQEKVAIEACITAEMVENAMYRWRDYLAK